MKTWQEEAMEMCAVRDIEIRDDDDLMEVFVDYCNPISHIESLQSQIAELKSELEKEREVVNEMALLNDHQDSCYYKKHIKDDRFLDDCNCYDHNHYNDENLSELARQRQRERK